MTRLPLATDLKIRIGASSTKDARQVNSYIETKGDQAVVRKRPAAQGGISVGTGTAQGGIGLTIGGTPYFIGFWGDTLVSYTLPELNFNWSSTTQYGDGDFIFDPDNNTGDPFTQATGRIKYYAQGPSLNKPIATHPAYWSTSAYTPATWSGNMGGVLTSGQPDLDSVINYYISWAAGQGSTYVSLNATYINATQVYFEFWNTLFPPKQMTNWGIATKA